MTVTYRAFIRARAGRSNELGNCLHSLKDWPTRLHDCLSLDVQRAPDDEHLWLLSGAWRSSQAMQQFFAEPLLQQVLSSALDQGLINSLECGASNQPQPARHSQRTDSS
ncbi:putative quinol monooxygenase [Pseudomonas borbori]